MSNYCTHVPPGETVYGQREVNRMQAELAALRQQVNTLTAALEDIATWSWKVEREGDWKGAYEDAYERAHETLAAVKKT